MMIRTATEADAAEISPLLSQMGFPLSVKKVIQRIRTFHERNHHVFVAEDAGHVRGVIAFGFYEEFRIEGRVCHVDTLVIHEDFRGRGIGRQLLAFVEDFAAKQQVTSMDLITHNDRRPSGTHAFYETLGYRDHVGWDYSYFSKVF